MIRRQWHNIAFGVLVSALVCGAASAQEQERPRADNNAGIANPAVVAVAPNARIAALIRHDLTVVRNKGVASVIRIAPGTYCIQPSAAAGVTPSNSIVVLTPEYFFSGANNIQVQWASNGSGCASNRIGVYTFLNGGFSNQVSFSIVVP